MQVLCNTEGYRPNDIGIEELMSTLTEVFSKANGMLNASSKTKVKELENESLVFSIYFENYSFH